MSCLKPKLFKRSVRSKIRLVARDRRLLSVRTWLMEGKSDHSGCSELFRHQNLSCLDVMSLRLYVRFFSRRKPHEFNVDTSTKPAIDLNASSERSRSRSSSRAARVKVKTRNRVFPSSFAWFDASKHRHNSECVLPLPAGARSRIARSGSVQNACCDVSSGSLDIAEFRFSDIRLYLASFLFSHDGKPNLPGARIQ